MAVCKTANAAQTAVVTTVTEPSSLSLVNRLHGPLARGYSPLYPPTTHVCCQQTARAADSHAHADDAYAQATGLLESVGRLVSFRFTVIFII